MLSPQFSRPRLLFNVYILTQPFSNLNPVFPCCYIIAQREKMECRNLHVFCMTWTAVKVSVSHLPPCLQDFVFICSCVCALLAPRPCKSTLRSLVWLASASPLISHTRGDSKWCHFLAFSYIPIFPDAVSETVCLSPCLVDVFKIKGRMGKQKRVMWQSPTYMWAFCFAKCCRGAQSCRVY